MEFNYAVVGKRIRATRKRKRLTQSRLAELVDKSVPYISYIEGGKSKFSLRTLVSIANVFEVSVDYLLEGNLIHIAQYWDEEWKDLVADCTAYERRGILKVARMVKGLLRGRLI